MRKLALFFALTGAAPLAAGADMTTKRVDQDGKPIEQPRTTQPTHKPKRPKASPEEEARAMASPGCRFWLQYMPPEEAKKMLACRTWHSLIN